jgi:RNA polymerase sigma factor (sigma-70 family)
MLINSKNVDSDLVKSLLKIENLDETLKFLYKNYYSLLEKFVLKNSGTKEDAQDVIQDTMIAFVEIVRQNKFREEAGINTLLYSIARNIWFAKIRKNKSQIGNIDTFTEKFEKHEPAISLQLEKQESLKYIMNLFETLGAACQQILTMYYFEELPMKEILLKTNYENEQVVRNKKVKCMKALTNKIELNPKMNEYLKTALQNLK